MIFVEVGYCLNLVAEAHADPSTRHLNLRFCCDPISTQAHESQHPLSSVKGIIILDLSLKPLEMI